MSRGTLVLALAAVLAIAGTAQAAQILNSGTLTVNTGAGTIVWSGGALTDYTGFTTASTSPYNNDIGVFSFSDSITFGSGLSVDMLRPSGDGQSSSSTRALQFNVTGDISIGATFNGLGV